MRRVILYLTLHCNYSCPYCYEKEYPPMRERSWKDWLELFNKQDKTFIDISGGEPFLYQKFVKLVKKLSKRHTVSVTTNFTRPDLLKKLKRNLHAVTLSYHPHTAEWRSFLREAKEMQRTFPDLAVNVVLYPDVLGIARKVVADLKLYGIRHHAEPYIYPDAPYTEEQMKTVRSIAGEDRTFGWQEPDEYSGREKLCDAGIEQQHWMPNGDVFACGSYLMLFMLNKVPASKQHYLGNLFDGTYRPRTEPITCDLPCVVGCDLDFHKDVWKLR